MKHTQKFFIILWVSFLGLHAQDEDDEMVLRKMAICQKMVEDAVVHFKNPRVSVGKACNDFSRNLKWRHGEIRIFIFGQGGECYLTEPVEKIWHDFYDETDRNSQSFLIEMLQQGEKGGWILYRWNNDTQHAYVKLVTKKRKKICYWRWFLSRISKIAIPRVSNYRFAYGYRTWYAVCAH